MSVVSVVMAVYNESDCVGVAIESILNQSFTDFEFIIVNDGSTDSTLDIIKSYHDKRIVIISHENKGLTISLNLAISVAEGLYIARQDADDISHSKRLEKQVDYFAKNDSVVLLGTRARVISGNNILFFSKYYDNQYISDNLVYRNLLIHSSVMFKKDKFIKVGCYNEKYITSQDYDAWIRLSKVGSVSIINEILVDRSVRKKSISAKSMFSQCKNSFFIRQDNVVSVFTNIKITFYQFFTQFIPIFIIKYVKKYFV